LNSEYNVNYSLSQIHFSPEEAVRNRRSHSGDTTTRIKARSSPRTHVASTIFVFDAESTEKGEKNEEPGIAWVVACG
jgi:hypothetical protein